MCQVDREGLHPHQLCSLKEQARPAGRAAGDVQRAKGARLPQTGVGQGVGKHLQPQTFHRKRALAMCMGDKYQAYLCHKADHLRFAQKTDGTVLVEGNREALRLRDSHGLVCLRSPPSVPFPSSNTHVI